ncbi:MAG: hypothetical protein PWP25_1652 [Sphaerochaeta sp.]|jgi:hypothetical protein|nr:hypothetical protein [Sphaerochaeta sp.]
MRQEKAMICFAFLLLYLIQPILVGLVRSKSAHSRPYDTHSILNQGLLIFNHIFFTA